MYWIWKTKNKEPKNHLVKLYIANVASQCSPPYPLSNIILYPFSECFLAIDCKIFLSFSLFSLIAISFNTRFIPEVGIGRHCISFTAFEDKNSLENTFFVLKSTMV